MMAVGRAILSTGSWVYGQVTSGLSAILSGVDSCTRPIFSGIFSLIYCQSFWANRSVETRGSALGSGGVPLQRGDGDLSLEKQEEFVDPKTLEDQRLAERLQEEEKNGTSDFNPQSHLEGSRGFELEEEDFGNWHDHFSPEEFERRERDREPAFVPPSSTSETDQQALAEQFLSLLLAEPSEEHEKEKGDLVLLIHALPEGDQQAIQEHCEKVISPSDLKALLENRDKIVEDHEIREEQDREFEDAKEIDRLDREEKMLAERVQQWQTDAKAFLGEITASNQENGLQISSLQNIERAVVNIARDANNFDRLKKEGQKGIEKLEKRIKDPRGSKLLMEESVSTKNLYAERFGTLQEQSEHLGRYSLPAQLDNLLQAYTSYCENLEKLKTLLAARDEWLAIKKQILESVVQL